MTPPTANVIRCLRTALGAADGGPTDAALLARFAQSQDAEAFELLVWRHAGMVMRVCRWRVRDLHAAEDASQAVFLALARQAAIVSRRGTVAGWLYRVAWRIAAKASRHRLPQLIADFDHQPAHEVEPVHDPALMHALHEELARLPEKYRVPLLLCFFEGLTHADAAKRLGWPLGTLGVRISRGKDLLHRRLLRRGIAMPAAGLAVLIVADAAPAFVSSTVTSAIAFATGKGVNAIPISVLNLAQGAIRNMTLMKLQWAASVLAACGVMIAGGAWAAGGGKHEVAPPEQIPVAGVPIAPPGGGIVDGQPVERVGVRIATSEQRRRSLNNLKQIVLAIHNYHEVVGHLPADIRDKDGKALLSWRVAILPYLEQDALYKQFKLDQPWDSEHNLKLLPKMPVSLRAGFEPKDATHTFYQVFSGVGTPFGPTRVIVGAEGGGAAGGPGAPPPAGAGGGPPALLEKTSNLPIKLHQVPDGTSNTFAIVEAGPAVAWTKPADLAYAANKPLPKLDGPFANAFHVSMLDGSAFAMKPDVDQKTLRIFIGMDDGIVTPSLKGLAAKQPVETEADRAELKRHIERNAKLIAESEELLKEHLELMKKQNAAATDFTQVEEQADRLKGMIDELKQMNRQLRGEPNPKPTKK